MLLGYAVHDIAVLINAFKDKGINEIDEMTKLVEDPGSSALDYKAQALAAEAKLNRIKTLLKD